MTKPGDILYHKQFRFYDGSVKEKLFIILCSGDEEAPCLALMVTSQNARYEHAVHGCNPRLKVFYIPIIMGEWFEEPTYVSLPYRYPIPIDEIREGIASRIIEIPSQISSRCLSEIKNCLKRNFIRDLSVPEMKRIF